MPRQRKSSHVPSVPAMPVMPSMPVIKHNKSVTSENEGTDGEDVELPVKRSLKRTCSSLDARPSKKQNAKPAKEEDEILPRFYQRRDADLAMLEKAYQNFFAACEFSLEMFGAVPRLRTAGQEGLPSDEEMHAIYIKMREAIAMFRRFHKEQP